MNKRKNSRRKPYVGSVRFFRHMILSIVALMIIIPTCLAVSLRKQNENLEKAGEDLYSQIAALQSQVKETKQEEEVLETEPVQITSNQYGEILVDINSWELMLVNDMNPISPKFKVNLKEIQSGQSVDSRIVNDLEDMIEDAKEEGFQLHVYSAYRDLKRQQSLFNDCLMRLQEDGMDYQQAFYESKARIALPGNSEHQTGLAVDIAARDYFYLDEERGNQKEAIWLAENSYRYGFILRYPADKEKITGIRYEPEHFRYVGKIVSKFLFENDLTLEEFHELIKENDTAGEA